MHDPLAKHTISGNNRLKTPIFTVKTDFTWQWYVAFHPVALQQFNFPIDLTAMNRIIKTVLIKFIEWFLVNGFFNTSTIEKLIAFYLIVWNG